MSKVVYPKEGILFKIKPMLVDSLTHLSNAQNNCSMNVPGDFEYVNYLRELGSKINGFQVKIKDVYTKAANTDTLFKTVKEEMSDVNERLNPNIIEKRDRLVKE